MEEQIRKLLKRFEEVEELLGQADVLLDQKKYRELAQEHAYLSHVKEQWQRIQATKRMSKAGCPCRCLIRCHT